LFDNLRSVCQDRGVAKPPIHAVRTLRPQPPPPGIYASRYRPDLALAICTRLAAGESLRSICRKDPSMPTEKTVWNWLRQHAAFAYMYQHALAQARAERRQAKAEREVARKAATAAARAARGWRPTPPWPDTYSEEIAAAICDRLSDGEALYQICRDPSMPSLGTVYNWLRRHPPFVTAYLEARDVAFAILQEVARDDAPWLGTYGASMRELKRRERAALRRLGQLWPRAFTGPPLRRELEVDEGPLQPDGLQVVEVSWAEDDGR
jgi:hypothetical protein